MGAPTPTPGHPAGADKLDDFVEGGAVQARVRSSPQHELVEGVFRHAFGTRGGDLGDNLLGEDVEGGDRRTSGVELTPPDRREERRALDELVSGHGVEPPGRRAADVVLGASDPLQPGGDGTRRPELADKLYRPDIDAELERCRRYHGLQLAGAQPALHPEPALHRQAAVMRLHEILADQLGELVRHPLGHATRVDEDERRAPFSHVSGDLLQDLGQLLVGRHGTELVVRQLDGDVERPPVSHVHDAAPNAAIRVQTVWPASDQQLGDRGDRSLSGGEPDAHGPCLHKGVKPLEAERKVRPALVTSESVDLIDDDSPHAREQFAAAL